MFKNASVEHLEIRENVKRASQSHIAPFQNERYYNTVPRELFRKFSQLGVTGLSLVDTYGGLAAGPSLTAAVLEEVARVDLGPAIFLSVHNMVSGIIQRFGSEEQKNRLLPKLSRGEYLAAFALTEPSAGSDASALKTTARFTGSSSSNASSFILNGEKCYITSAGFAEVYLVFARTSGSAGRSGISAFVLELPGGAPPPGFSVSKAEQKMGCELSPIASIQFSDCHLPAHALLGELDDGYRIALSGLASGRINIAACAVGLAEAAIALSQDHLCNREQFGSKLIEFQGLRFMLADMKIRLEAARALTERAAHVLEQDSTDRDNRILPSIAKCFATDAAMQIATDAVQLLGGAGYIKEYKVEKLMRDAKMLQIVEGTNQIQRVVIAREMVRG